jgi:hypothetical protein
VQHVADTLRPVSGTGNGLFLRPGAPGALAMDRAAPIAGTGLAAEKATEACACPLISQLAKTDDAYHAQPLKNEGYSGAGC